MLIFCVCLGIAELTIRSFSFSLTSANLFSEILWKSATARCLWPVLSQTAGTTNPIRALQTLRQRLHGTGSVWNRYEIVMDKSCVYTGPGGSSTNRICYLVPNGSTYEDDPMSNWAVPVWNRSRVTRVDPIPNGSEHIRSRVNVA